MKIEIHESFVEVDENIGRQCYLAGVHLFDNAVGLVVKDIENNGGDDYIKKVVEEIDRMKEDFDDDDLPNPFPFPQIVDAIAKYELVVALNVMGKENPFEEPFETLEHNAYQAIANLGVNKTIMVGTTARHFRRILFGKSVEMWPLWLVYFLVEFGSQEIGGKILLRLANKKTV